MTKITLHINMSPGDIRYAEATVPAILDAYAGQASESIAIVDCCRPQKTRLVDPKSRFPDFEGRVEQLRAICDGFQRRGLFNRIEYLTPDRTDLFSHLSRKYLGGLASRNQTHEIGGTALMSYYAGLEFSETRFAMHFDADMLVFRDPEAEWVRQAVQMLTDDDRIINAIPRPSPPDFAEADKPSLSQGRPCYDYQDGWMNDWFSTRCYLFDKSKLVKALPLIGGARFAMDLGLKIMGRRFPRAPEITFFRQFARMGYRTWISKEQRCWTLHPVDKGERFLRLLPKILRGVKSGIVPRGQCGNENVQLDAWESPCD